MLRKDSGRPLLFEQRTLTSSVADPASVIRFSVPLIGRERFTSSLMNAENFAANGDMPHEQVAERVARQLKPIGFIGDWDGDRIAACADTVREAGGLASVHQHAFDAYEDEDDRPYWFATLACDRLVSEIGDLEALQADYADWLADAPAEVLCSITAELERIAPLPLSSFEQFGDVETTWNEGVRSAAGLVRCGLLLGYPAWSTATLIRADYGLPGGHDHY